MEHLIKNWIKSEIQLMVWETDPRLRNINNEIQFHATKTLKISKGDIIKVDKGSSYSCYEITDIITEKEANLKGKIHFTALTKWSNKPYIEDSSVQ